MQCEEMLTLPPRIWPSAVVGMGPPGDGRRGQLCRDDTGWPASACGSIYLGEREDKPARDPVKTV